MSNLYNTYRYKYYLKLYKIYLFNVKFSNYDKIDKWDQ